MGIDAHFLALRRSYQGSGSIQISFDGSSVARRHELTLFVISTQVADSWQQCFQPTLAIPQVRYLVVLFILEDKPTHLRCFLKPNRS